MVYGIIERHRGRLDIESAPGQGTTFTISLPIADAVKISPPIQQKPNGRKSKLSILAVDDDERVCEVVAHYLRGDGHDVTVATSGREAITRAQQKRFDIIFLDRAMPQMSGDQTAELIKQLHPALPIILLTGFGALIEVTGSRPRAVDAVVGKPVSLGTLRETIDKHLYAAYPGEARYLQPLPPVRLTIRSFPTGTRPGLEPSKNLRKIQPSQSLFLLY